VVELSLFGSILREDFHPDSDMDVLVTFAPNAEISLFDLVQLKCVRRFYAFCELANLI